MTSCRESDGLFQLAVSSSCWYPEAGSSSENERDIWAALAIWRARMARRCLPRDGARTSFFLRALIGTSASERRAHGGHLDAYAADGMADVEDDPDLGEEDADWLEIIL